MLKKQMSGGQWLNPVRESEAPSPLKVSDTVRPSPVLSSDVYPVFKD